MQVKQRKRMRPLARIDGVPGDHRSGLARFSVFLVQTSKVTSAKTPLTPTGIMPKCTISTRGSRICAPFRERRRKTMV